MNTTHIVTAVAYERKDSLGGGFIGKAKDRRTGEILAGEVRQTLDQARYDAKTLAAKLYGDVAVAPGYHAHRKNEWGCNYWAVE